MEEKRIKVKKDYSMCGIVIPKGTILKLTDVSKPSREIYVDKKGNQFVFDTSEIMFSGCFCDTNEELNDYV